MSYHSLYRKYRPQNFSQLIGQNHIRQMLSNQLKTDNVGHCYLFTGTRGTGKTSVAKIFARSVNCLNILEDGSPCNQCEACKYSLNYANTDILELDAASNNSVNEVRELKEIANYPPTFLKYKVFIIDEAHMLSSSANNALLKLLEEPPEYCIFILATTEIQKIPQTILSRCLILDFRLVSLEELSKRLEYIFDDLKVSYSPEAIKLIASKGEGSVRDMLSIADMCYAYSGNNISYDDVVEVIGASSPKSVINLLNLALSSNYDKVLVSIDDLVNKGKSLTSLYKDLIYYMSRLVYVKLTDKNNILDIPMDILTYMDDIAKNYSLSKLTRAMYTLSEGEGQLRLSGNVRIFIESLLLQLGDSSSDIDNNKLLMRLKVLEEELLSVKNQLMSGNIQVQSVTPPQPMVAEQPSFVNVAIKFSTVDKNNFREVWGKLVTYYREKKELLLYCTVSELTPKEITSDNEIIMVVNDKSNYAKLNEPIIYNEITDFINAHYKVKIKITFELTSDDNIQQKIEISNVRDLFPDNDIKLSK